MTCLDALLDSVIDYAGLFPPARLDMPTAVSNFGGYRQGLHYWMLGRFIVPIDRLGEFEHAAAETLSYGDLTRPWRLSALVTPTAEELDLVGEFNRRHQGIAKIDSLEFKATAPSDISFLADLIPPTVAVYVETALDKHLPTLLDAIQARGLRAKIRTGGVTPDTFPSISAVLSFLVACRDRGLPFKATAGLHHPLRSVHPLTYEPGCPKGPMHGFLNISLAAAFLHHGLPESDAARLLAEPTLDDFRLTPEGIHWHSHVLSSDDVATARREFFISFGSCSFQEPIDDLTSLSLL